MKVIAYARRWFIDGEKAVKVRNENGRLAWPFKFKLLEISQLKALPDDEPLVTLAEAEAAVKQARIDAIEEAAAICQANASMCSEGVMRLTLEANADAIESLKGKT